MQHRNTAGLLRTDIQMHCNTETPLGTLLASLGPSGLSVIRRWGRRAEVGLTAGLLLLLPVCILHVSRMAMVRLRLRHCELRLSTATVPERTILAVQVRPEADADDCGNEDEYIEGDDGFELRRSMETSVSLGRGVLSETESGGSRWTHVSAAPVAQHAPAQKAADAFRQVLHAPKRDDGIREGEAEGEADAPALVQRLVVLPCDDEPVVLRRRQEERVCCED